MHEQAELGFRTRPTGPAVAEDGLVAGAADPCKVPGWEGELKSLFKPKPLLGLAAHHLSWLPSPASQHPEQSEQKQTRMPLTLSP